MVERMAEHGARVVVSSRTAADCEAVANAIDARYGADRALGIPCDVSNREQLRNLVERTLAHWGRVDCAIANALAPGSSTPWIERIDMDEFDASLSGNITNSLYLAKLVVPAMRAQGGGSIIFNASSSGIAALEDYPAYGTAKAGLIHLARILAVQLGPSNIRVNTIAPGIIKTSSEGGTWERADLVELGVGETPLGRLGTPDEIAACAVFLASPGGAFATGSCFLVDGGQTLRGMAGPHRVREALKAEARAARNAGQDAAS
jgi:NAD(P)-dependent dehydrogenase (short-subunit alcohol dehydrogenase family)